MVLGRLAALLGVRGPREGPTFHRDEQGLMAALAEPSADQQFSAAFRAWGLDVDAVPVAEATARLRGRPGPVVTEVIAALDEWASERRRKGPAARWRRLAELAQALVVLDHQDVPAQGMGAHGGLLAVDGIAEPGPRD